METESGDAPKPLRRKIYVPILNLSRIVVARLISESASYNAAAISIISYSLAGSLDSALDGESINRKSTRAAFRATLRFADKDDEETAFSSSARSLSLSLSLSFFLFFLSSPILARAIIHKSREASILYGL